MIVLQSSVSMNCFRLIWPHLKAALEVTYVSIEIAAVGAVIAWLQLRYAKSRDKALDIRNDWEKVHKIMLEFRLRREVLNHPQYWGKDIGAAALEAFESLHILKGQLDRMPDSQLVGELAGFLDENWSADQWRADSFAEQLDKYAHEAALRARPTV
jgi:hypothetical protein